MLFFPLQEAIHSHNNAIPYTKLMRPSDLESGSSSKDLVKSHEECKEDSQEENEENLGMSSDRHTHVRTANSKSRSRKQGKPDESSRNPAVAHVRRLQRQGDTKNDGATVELAILQM